MGLFVSWLYIFPMFGPFLQRISWQNGTSPTEIFLLFVGFHGVGLLGYGAYFAYLEKSKKHAKIQLLMRSMVTFTIASAGLTLFFAVCPAGLKPWAMAGLGLCAAPIMIMYQVYLSAYYPVLSVGKRIGWALFVAEIVFIIFTLFCNDVSVIWSVIFVIFLLILSLPLFQVSLMSADVMGQQSKQIIKAEGNRKNHFIKLLAMVFFWYLVTGLMYSLTYPAWVAKVNDSVGVENASYMIAALLAGYFADQYVRQHMVLISLSFSGIGYLVLYALSGHVVDIIAICVLQCGSAFLDVYLFSTLAEIAASDSNPALIWGIGLCVNLMAIFVSNGVLYIGNDSLWLMSGFKFIGIILIFVLIPISNALVFSDDLKKGRFYELQAIAVQHDRMNLSEPVQNDATKEFDGLFIQYHFTPREKQVAELLLKGSNIVDIEQELNIKVTTIKTHLRGIYNKTNTNSQKEFILLMHHDSKK